MIKILKNWAYAFVLMVRTVKELRFVPRQWGRCVEQSCMIGYQTLPIVAIMSIFIGGVLALQSGFSLSKLPGAQKFLGSIVGLSMCRELGPLMTAFLLAGRVGSAITAELASMSIYKEVDALLTMNLSPERLLVMPRVLSAALMMPFLTMFSVILGWFGGWIVVHAVDFITIDGTIYWRTLKQFVDLDSIHDGLIKAEVFALTITLICSAIGLRTQGGPREIGSAVTSAVVQSMIAILVLDYFLTKMLL